VSLPTSRSAGTAVATDAGRTTRRARLPRRLLQLYAGLGLMGLSMGLMLTSGLGLNPWDVLHQGLAGRTGLRFGWVVIGVSALVLLAWIPLRQRPGFGTVCNAVLVGLAADAALAVLPHPSGLPLRLAYLLVGILANGLSTALYIGAGLGPGPRDGVMTALSRRGHSLRTVRTCMEVVVLGVGWSLGGTVGVGTLLYAASIGPIIHFFIPRRDLVGQRRGRVRRTSPGVVRS